MSTIPLARLVRVSEHGYAVTRTRRELLALRR